MRLSFVIVLFLLSSSSFAQTSEWKLEKNENGIRVYTRRIDEFPVDEIKAVMTVKASLSAIVSVITDADHYTDWIYACAESKVIEKVSNTEQYQYQVNDVPYPFSDRDVVIHFTLIQDPFTKVITTESHGEDGYLPEQEDRVRIPEYFAGYVLTPKPNGEVEILYQLKLNPGGNLPGWLVNTFIIKGPYESTLKMKDVIAEENNKGVKLSFIAEVNP